MQKNQKNWIVTFDDPILQLSYVHLKALLQWIMYNGPRSDFPIHCFWKRCSI